MAEVKKIKTESGWTLFLDRDGVINERLVDEYVLNYSQFKFLPHVLEALKILSGKFFRIIIVSNQQGIGKGLMTEKDLEEIHGMMMKEIEAGGGRIDRIYYCPNKAEDMSHMRKPDVGMGLQAKKDFPEIDFKKSVMVGDSLSDMEFGHRLKMIKVFISEDIKTIRENYMLIDYAYKDLYDFALNLE